MILKALIFDQFPGIEWVNFTLAKVDPHCGLHVSKRHLEWEIPEIYQRVSADSVQLESGQSLRKGGRKGTDRNERCQEESH